MTTETKGQMSDAHRKWLSDRFNVPADSVLWYNSGCCYSRIALTTKRAAKAAAKAVAGETVNGGWFDGMPLGAITEIAARDGAPSYFEVMV